MQIGFRTEQRHAKESKTTSGSFSFNLLSSRMRFEFPPSVRFMHGQHCEDLSNAFIMVAPRRRTISLLVSLSFRVAFDLAAGPGAGNGLG